MGLILQASEALLLVGEQRTSFAFICHDYRAGYEIRD
jgi:hypothetical protein